MMPESREVKMYLIQASPDTLYGSQAEVWRSGPRYSKDLTQKFDRLSVPRPDVEEVRTKTSNTTGTVILVTGVVLVIGGLMAGFVAAVDGMGTDY